MITFHSGRITNFFFIESFLQAARTVHNTTQSSGIRMVFLVTGVGDDPLFRLSPETGIYRLR